MRPAWLAFLLIAPATAAAQERQALTALGLEPAAWSRWETRVPDLRQHLAQAGITVDEGVALADFHVVDVDADGRPDIVFSGRVPCRGCQVDFTLATTVYRNTETRYVRAFTSDRPVVALRRPEPREPLVLALGNPVSDAMCGEATFRLLFSGVPAPPDTAFLRPLGQLSYRSLTRWPAAPLPTPFRVRVAQDSYNLRAAPIVDDTTVMWQGSCEYEDGQRGNVITAFAMGTMGVAVAQQQVGPRIWYLVVTDEGSTETRFGARAPGTPPTRHVGWMSSRWLQTIPESAGALPWPPRPSGRR